MPVRPAPALGLTLAIAATASVLRFSLIASGIGLDYLTTRIEVSTPVNGLLPIKEGAYLLRVGTSPFSGSVTHVPPLLLWGLSGVVDHSLLYAVPQTAADLIAAWLLRRIMLLTTAAGAAEQQLGIGADGLMAIYLFNPFCIMSTVAGTVTPFENLSIMAAAYAACTGNVFLTAAFLACGIYIGLQPVFLMIPLAVLAVQSMSVRRQAPRLVSARETATKKLGSHAREGADAEEGSSFHLGPYALTCTSLALATAFAFLLLVAWSDLLVQRSFSQDQCLPKLLSWASDRSRQQLPQGSHRLGSWASRRMDADQAGGCWASHVYSLPLMFKDLTPNIGQWWYFFAEIFPQQRAFFCFVAHALCGMFALPLALRFPAHGTLLLVIQVGMSTMLRPYPSVGDLGLYLSMLPLVHQQLCRIKIGLLLSNSLLLLAVLGPAMWTQWIDAESANSNFFYSITLLLGAWHTLLLLQLLVATVDNES